MAVKNLRIRTHSEEDLIYLDKDDPVFKKIIIGG
jgi:hypothetical protein